MTASNTNIISTATSTNFLQPRRIPNAQFTELLGRSNFSFLQGASHPEEMALHAQTLGYSGFALCDLNGLYGAVRAWQAIEYPSQFVMPQMPSSNKNFNFHRTFQFHCGAEMQLADRSSIALLPMNKEGYYNLCQLITKSKREVEKTFSNLSLEDLVPLSDDLVALALPPWTATKLLHLKDIFPGRLYMPVWKDYSWQSLEFYNQALQLEKLLNIPLVATNRPLMHDRSRKPLHDVLTCIYHKTTLAEAKTRLICNGERHLKPLAELIDLWRDRPDILTRTVEVAARLNFSLKELKYEYPEAARPSGVEAADHLRHLTEDGLKKHFPQGLPQKVRDDVEHELDLIHKMKFEDYFLTLRDVCAFADSKGILHQGRGSAANSVVCYALGLTAVDPTKVKLLFERFISEERGEPPDIDIDFESGRREEVLQYIYEKYGSTHAAMVCTVICYRSRMALRDCCKVLGIPLETADKMVKFMGREGLSRLELSTHMADSWGMTTKQYKLLMEMSRSLKGFPRHLGIHTGGFMITKRPITQCVPVEKATMDKRFVVQWNKDDLNILKMLKVDLLGLGMLTALKNCFELLKQRGVEMDLYSIPPEDKPTYDMIQIADTIGVFQIESRAQMSLLPRLKPKTFYDLVVEVAIVRPGPIQGGMIHPYLKRRHGEEPVTYAHPSLKPILERTFGIPIFQEQVMQIASSVGGFTPGESDELRRIMSSSWKKQDLMKGIRQRLISGMISNGIKLEYAEQIYQTIVGFSSYGFPESHSASFALLTYASCYIKRHFPGIFVCSLLNAQPMGFYSPRQLIADAQRHRVRFLPLDVQKSQFDYTLEGNAVRSGFRTVRGIKEADVEKIMKAREQGGPFLNFSDLLQRSGLTKPALIRMAAAGAFASLGLPAREALWQIQRVDLKHDSLFFARTDEQDKELIPQESDWEEMSREYKTIGYSLHLHPLGILRGDLQKISERERQNNSTPYTKANDLLRMRDRQKVRIAGLLSLMQRPPTAKGFCFLTLEDETGCFNVVLLPQIYEAFRLVISSHVLLEIKGHVERQGRVIHIKAAELRALQIELVADLPIVSHSLLQSPSRSL
jgi:DNA-directed DNA polymerase III PolC